LLEIDPDGPDVAARLRAAPAEQLVTQQMQIARENARFAAIDPASLSSGAAQASLLVPAGSAPSFDGAGLEIDYVIRVLVDRRLRTDAAIERPLAVV